MRTLDRVVQVLRPVISLTPKAIKTMQDYILGVIL